jgi:hypothetical protein
MLNAILSLSCYLLSDSLTWKVLLSNVINKRANFKTAPFAQYLRQAQILILEIFNVFLWLIPPWRDRLP